MTIREEKESLFDENFNCIVTDPEKIVTDPEKIIHFCNRLKAITGIHTCNHLGMTYEYLPIVYESALTEEN